MLRLIMRTVRLAWVSQFTTGNKISCEVGRIMTMN
jgi:hypothetical protein